MQLCKISIRRDGTVSLYSQKIKFRKHGIGQQGSIKWVLNSIYLLKIKFFVGGISRNRGIHFCTCNGQILDLKHESVINSTFPELLLACYMGIYIYFLPETQIRVYNYKFFKPKSKKITFNM